MSDLASYRKHSLAKQVVALKHRLSLMEKTIQKIGTDFGRKENDSELRKILHLFFRSFQQAIEDLFYRDQYDKFCETIGKHFKVSSEQLDEIKRDLEEMGIITESDYPTPPIIKKNEPLNYYRVMRELCEDVERELEEKMIKEGKE